MITIDTNNIISAFMSEICCVQQFVIQSIDRRLRSVNASVFCFVAQLIFIASPPITPTHNNTDLNVDFLLFLRFNLYGNAIFDCQMNVHIRRCVCVCVQVANVSAFNWSDYLNFRFEVAMVIEVTSKHLTFSVELFTPTNQFVACNVSCFDMPEHRNWMDLFFAFSQYWKLKRSAQKTMNLTANGPISMNIRWLRFFPSMQFPLEKHTPNLFTPIEMDWVTSKWNLHVNHSCCVQ